MPLNLATVRKQIDIDDGGWDLKVVAAESRMQQRRRTERRATSAKFVTSSFDVSWFRPLRHTPVIELTLSAVLRSGRHFSKPCYKRTKWLAETTGAKFLTAGNVGETTRKEYAKVALMDAAGEHGLPFVITLGKLGWQTFLISRVLLRGEKLEI